MLAYTGFLLQIAILMNPAGDSKLAEFTLLCLYAFSIHPIRRTSWRGLGPRARQLKYRGILKIVTIKDLGMAREDYWLQVFSAWFFFIEQFADNRTRSGIKTVMREEMLTLFTYLAVKNGSFSVRMLPELSGARQSISGQVRVFAQMSQDPDQFATSCYHFVDPLPFDSETVAQMYLSDELEGAMWQQQLWWPSKLTSNELQVFKAKDEAGIERELRGVGICWTVNATDWNIAALYDSLTQ